MIKGTNKPSHRPVCSNVLSAAVLVNGLICRRSTDGTGARLSYANKLAVRTAF